VAHQKLQRQQGGDQQGQAPRQTQHDRADGGQREHTADEGRRRVGTEALHFGNVAVEAAHQIAHRYAREAPRRYPEQMRIHRAAQRKQGAPGGADIDGAMQAAERESAQRED
jgi:hypothetical protein